MICFSPEHPENMETPQVSSSSVAFRDNKVVVGLLETNILEN